MFIQKCSYLKGIEQWYTAWMDNATLRGHKVLAESHHTKRMIPFCVTGQEVPHVPDSVAPCHCFYLFTISRW